MARGVSMLGGKLVLNIAGFHELRTLPVMHALVLRAAKLAEARADQLGLDYTAELSPGHNRARAVLVPADAASALETARQPALLLHALDAARHVL